MGCPARVAWWRAVHLQLLPPLGHTIGQEHHGWVRPLLAQQEGHDPGGPLAMIAYGIGVFPLIRDLRRDHPRVTLPWYADDAGGGRGIWGHYGPLQGPPTEGAGPGVFSRAHQEHLGGGREECTLGQGLLPRDRRIGRVWKLIPWRIHRGAGDKGSVNPG